MKMSYLPKAATPKLVEFRKYFLAEIFAEVESDLRAFLTEISDEVLQCSDRHALSGYQKAPRRAVTRRSRRPGRNFSLVLSRSFNVSKLFGHAPAGQSLLRKFVDPFCSNLRKNRFTDFQRRRIALI